jgi:transposase
LFSFSYIKYAIDEEAKKHGIDVLRLPPYNCEINPIEPYWAEIKRPIRDEPSANKATVKQLHALVLDQLATISPERIQKHIDHVKEKVINYVSNKCDYFQCL